MVVVSDTSPVSNLAIIRRLALLEEQFGAVRLPRAPFSRLAGKQRLTPQNRPLILTPHRQLRGTQKSQVARMFNNPTQTKPTPKTMADINSPATGSSRNLLSSDVEIKGSIKFQNDLTIDGKVEGEIASPGNLTIGENAEIRGEIKTKSVTVHGKVFGNITVDERCELKGRSVLQGDLKAARLVIEEGATFVGKSEVTPNRIPMKQPEIVRAPDQKQQAQGGR
jgi:cytoskeletal protein CcmA (bactofilin family)